MARDPLYNSEAHRNFTYVQRGQYAEQLARWFDVFPREQFLILRSEDFFADTRETFEQVLVFLGLPSWHPAQFQRFNAARRTTGDADEREARRWLARHYEPHNQKLAELLGRDFGWKEP